MLRNSLATALLLFLAAPALACDVGGISLFVCGTGPTSEEGYIAICDMTGEGDETDQLQFELLTVEGKQLRYPKNPADGPESFFFSNSSDDDGYLVNIRFAIGEKEYNVYSLDIPPDPNDEYDAGGGAAGVEITAANGDNEVIMCSERPYMFISYLRDSMRCDLDNPLGEAACDVDSVPDTLPDDAGAPGY